MLRTVTLPIFRLPRTKLRSEEHTSELQSQSNLVCRLLLEKKKTIQNSSHRHLRWACFDLQEGLCPSRLRIPSIERKRSHADNEHRMAGRRVELADPADTAL